VGRTQSTCSGRSPWPSAEELILMAPRVTVAAAEARQA
jgi:hypothetical protein